MKWQQAKWSEVLDIKNGKDQKKVADPNGQYPIYGSGGPMGFANDYLCEQGTTVIGRKGSINSPIFVNERFWNVDTAFGLSPKAGLDNRFLFHFCIQYNFLKHNKATTLPSLTKKDLLNIQIPLPPLDEQKRIAAILDATDALRAKRRQSIAQLDTLIQSTFLDLFGDPVTNPMGWPRISLGELAREKPNNGIFRKNPDYVQEGKSGLPVVWVEELFRGSSIKTDDSRRVIPVGSEIQKYGLKYGDILFCRSSLKLDGIAFNNVYLGIDDAALFECHVIRISPDLTRLSPIYLNTLLRLPQLRAIAKSKSKTATMTTIDQKGLCSIDILLPPLKLQQVFANQIAAVEKLKTLHRAHLTELDALFTSLQHRAFRGEL